MKYDIQKIINQGSVDAISACIEAEIQHLRDDIFRGRFEKGKYTKLRECIKNARTHCDEIEFLFNELRKIDQEQS